MTISRIRSLAFILCCAVSLVSIGWSASAAAASASGKFARIAANARKSAPDPRPVTLTAEEINAYFAEKNVQMPEGVEEVTFSSEPGFITANTRVDFDAIRRGRNSSNPLFAVFTGVHDLRVVSEAEGSNGDGTVRIDSVAIDGVKVPRMVVEAFVDRYITPRYPKVGMETAFRLPSRIDSAKVGKDEIVLTQK